MLCSATRVLVYLGFLAVADTAVREVKEETGVDAGKKYDTIALRAGTPFPSISVSFLQSSAPSWPSASTTISPPASTALISTLFAGLLP